MQELFSALAGIFETAGIIAIFIALVEKGLRIIVRAITGKERFM